jgi:hypothetical protein
MHIHLEVIELLLVDRHHEATRCISATFSGERAQMGALNLDNIWT